MVTALFFDTVGSTTLGERMDPEDLQLLVGRGVDRMVAAIERFGGSVRTPSGDGAMALFGAPVAHEDDPERAVRAGLWIIEEMEAYAREVRGTWNWEGFGVRVGVETGLVALSDVGGGGGTGAMGDALNTAARLESAAAPGTVLVGERTQRLVGHLFGWEGPVELSLKGKAEPVRAWRALQAHPGAPRRRASATPLVGRAEELARVRAAADALLARRGGVLVLRGEAGLGKTRLLAEARARVEAGGGQWLEGRCVSFGEGLALHPFEELLAPLDGVGLLQAPPGLPPQLASERVFAAVHERLAKLATATPLAIALEDIHWADESSLALLGRLLDLPARVPLLILLSARPESAHPSAALLAEACVAAGARTIDLPGIAPEAERRLLAHLLGDRGVSTAFADQVLDRAEGNPLYLEELAHSVAQSGASTYPRRSRSSCCRASIA